jgi:hypothetical protein
MITQNGITYLNKPGEGKDYYLSDWELTCRECCGRIFLAVPVAEIFREVRKLHGDALTMTSCSRCEAKQRRLARDPKTVAAKNIKTASHVLGLGGDIGVPHGKDKAYLRGLIIKAAAKLGYRPRIGWKAYAPSLQIVHYDLGFLIKPVINPNYVEGLEF